MKSIILLCYNRPEKTKQCLASLKKLYLIETYELVVARQTDSSLKSKQVENLINEIDWIKVHHCLYKPKKMIL